MFSSALQAAVMQRQSRKRFLEALDDLSRAQAVSKKIKMHRIIAKATIAVLTEDVEQERLSMATIHAIFKHAGL